MESCLKETKKAIEHSFSGSASNENYDRALKCKANNLIIFNRLRLESKSEKSTKRIEVSNK